MTETIVDLVDVSDSGRHWSPADAVEYAKQEIGDRDIKKMVIAYLDEDGRCMVTNAGMGQLELIGLIELAKISVL